MQNFLHRPQPAAWLTAALLLAAAPAALAQVGVGTTTPNAKAALEISATDKGLLIPRLTEAQRTALGTGLPNGLMIFQTDNTVGFWYFFGGSWVNLPSGPAAGDNLGNHTATQNLNLAGNQLVSGGSQGIAISSAGNVGIGTTAPTATLDVKGTLRTTAADVDGTVAQTTNATNYAVAGDVGQSFQLPANATITRIDLVRGSAGTATGTLTIFDGTPGGTVLGTQSGLTYTNGANNITLTTPVTVGAAGTYSFSTGVTGWRRSSGDVYAGGSIYNGTAATANDLVFTVYYTVVGSSTLYSTSGRVGIGTETPTAQLDVAGSTRLRSLSTAGYVTTDASGNLSSAAAPTATGTAGGDLTGTFPNPTIGTGAVGTTKLADNAVTSTKLADDAVTIPKLAATGTASATTYLRGDNTWATPGGDNLGNHVATQTLALADFPLHLRTASDGNHRLSWTSGTDGPELVGFSGGLLGTRTNNTTTGVLGWKSSGRVGIGVAAGNPAATLHVGGGSSTVRLEGLGGTGSRMVVADGSGNLSTQAIPGGTGTDWSLTGNATTGNEFLGTTNNQDLIFKRNNDEAFRVLGNGRVTLGINTPSSASVLLGFNAGVSNTSAVYNVVVGARAGEQINSNNSTFLGYGAGQQTTGGGNTLVGFYAGNRLTTGTNNVFIGNTAGYNGSSNITGNNNVVIGTSSGSGLGSNTNNLLIGGNANASAGLYDAYAIGNNTTVDQSNALVIGNVRGTNDAINVGIGTSTPSSSLQVNGTFAVGVVNNFGGGTSGGPNGLDQGGINSTTIIGGYYGLTPGNNSNYYQLPNPTSCPGRIYYLRNNSGSNSAYLLTTGGSIYGASSPNAVSSTLGYEMRANAASKTVIAISDGINWTVGYIN